MRCPTAWLFLFLQAFRPVISSEAEQKPLAQEASQDALSNPDLSPWSRSATTDHDSPPPVHQPGTNLVDAALVKLREIHPITNRRRLQRHGSIFEIVRDTILATLHRFFVIGQPTDENSSSPHRADGPTTEAVKLLDLAAQQNNTDALFLLAEINFYGNYSHPRNFKLAFDNYQKLASLSGNSSAAYMVGLMYSTGVGGAVERDQARALLYYTFAAKSGNMRAEMAVAYRHHGGIGTPKDCERAVESYRRVAEKALDWYTNGPPGGRIWTHQAHRIADEIGGVYGEGASAVSAGPNAFKAHPNSDAHASIEDVIEYLDLMSRRGYDFKASYNLGRIYYEGRRGLERDAEVALKYFSQIVQRYWKKGRVAENVKPGLERWAGKAAGYIGRMHLRGDGVEESFDLARHWLERGAGLNDPQSLYGLGLIFLNGHSFPRNIPKATELFKAAADQDYAPAQVQLAILYLDQGNADDIASANHYFELAARYSNLEAYYYLAEMARLGVGRDKSCHSAQSFYKTVVELTEPFLSSWTEANTAYRDGDHDLALLNYIGLAEQGYEKAQNNVAFLLDSDQSRLPKMIHAWFSRQSDESPAIADPTLALMYWTRSSRQGNIDSAVKMGDYYLRGIGASREVDKAVQCYTSVAEYHQSSQAMYNIGWMYENGVGLHQDFHLAKRFYDYALEANSEAQFPVALSLLKLRVRSAWNTLTNGEVKSIQEEAVPQKEWSLSEWISNFLRDDYDEDDGAASDHISPHNHYDDDDDDLNDPDNGLWVDNGDVDHHDHRYHHSYSDGTMDGPDADDDNADEGVLESLVIIALFALLLFLIYYRQQRQGLGPGGRNAAQQAGAVEAVAAAQARMDHLSAMHQEARQAQERMAQELRQAHGAQLSQEVEQDADGGDGGGGEGRA